MTNGEFYWSLRAKFARKFKCAQECYVSLKQETHRYSVARDMKTEMFLLIRNGQPASLATQTMQII